MNWVGGTRARRSDRKTQISEYAQQREHFAKLRVYGKPDQPVRISSLSDTWNEWSDNHDDLKVSGRPDYWARNRKHRARTVLIKEDSWTLFSGETYNCRTAGIGERCEQVIQDPNDGHCYGNRRVHTQPPECLSSKSVELEAINPPKTSASIITSASKLDSQDKISQNSHCSNHNAVARYETSPLSTSQAVLTRLHQGRGRIEGLTWGNFIKRQDTMEDEIYDHHIANDLLVKNHIGIVEHQVGDKGLIYHLDIRPDWSQYIYEGVRKIFHLENVSRGS